MSTSVRGSLVQLVKMNHRPDGTKLYVSPSVVEAAILETLYEDDKWVDGIGTVCGAEVEVDPDLKDGSAYVPLEPLPVVRSRHGNSTIRMSDHLALRKYGPRKRGGF